MEIFIKFILIIPLIIVSLTPIHVSAQDDPTPAFSQSQGNEFSSIEEYLTWYQNDTRGVLSNFSQDILIEGDIYLKQTESKKDMNSMDHTLIVKNGGSLIIDNSNICLIGYSTIIRVEAGGKLVLNKGSMWGNPSADAIVIEPGGKIEIAETFTVEEGNILDKNKNEGNTEKPINPLQYDYGPEYTALFQIGAEPESLQLPETVLMNYVNEEQNYCNVDLPVNWQLQDVDFNTVGQVEVIGVFDEKILTERGLSNPNNITVKLILTIYQQGSIENLRAVVLRVEKVDTVVNLVLPQLPEDTEAVYIYVSEDQMNWQPILDDEGNLKDYKDIGNTLNTNTFIIYRYNSDYISKWIKLDIVGSYYAGETNAAKIEIPESASPDHVEKPEHNDDFGDSGGDRGGGQHEGDRNIPQTNDEPQPEETITQPEISEKFESVVEEPKNSEPVEEPKNLEPTPSFQKANNNDSALNNQIPTILPETDDINLTEAIEDVDENIAIKSKKDEQLILENEWVLALPEKEIKVDTNSRGIALTALLSSIAAVAIFTVRFKYKKK